jgi:hypothetical protein
MVLKTLEMLAFSKCKLSEIRFQKNGVEQIKWTWWISEKGIVYKCSPQISPVQPHYPGIGRGLAQSLFSLVWEPCTI